MAVGIFYSIITTKTHNCILEANLHSRVACWERFLIPLPTFYKPMIKVQMHLDKTDGVIPSHLCYLLVSSIYPSWPWYNYYILLCINFWFSPMSLLWPGITMIYRGHVIYKMAEIYKNAFLVRSRKRVHRFVADELLLVFKCVIDV